MNHELGLRVLSQIMLWDDDEARKEFRWLTFMSQYKYDGYRDYLSGVRFIERLATWLQQFEPQDRADAYNFIKNNLIYISPAEIQRLIEKFFPEVVQRHLVKIISNHLKIPQYKVWSTNQAIEEFNWQTRKTLFMGLSDGARIDALRRANVGCISNEQVVANTQIDITKWESLIKDLREDLDKIRPGQGRLERFSRFYLVDDFTASGTSLIRYDEDKKKYKGKIEKFYNSIKSAQNDLKNKYGEVLDENWELIIHHYIGTESSKKAIQERYIEALTRKPDWNKNFAFTFSMLLPTDIALNKDTKNPFVKICLKYYNPAIENKHSAESGTSDMTFGYGQCGLPLVLEHNTPNNSLPLLWADVLKNNGKHAMRSLFRRRQRHTDLIE